MSEARRGQAAASTAAAAAAPTAGSTDAREAKHAVSGTSIAAVGLAAAAAATFAPESTAAAISFVGHAIAGVAGRLAPIVGPVLADEAGSSAAEPALLPSLARAWQQTRRSALRARVCCARRVAGIGQKGGRRAWCTHSTA